MPQTPGAVSRRLMGHGRGTRMRPIVPGSGGRPTRKWRRCARRGSTRQTSRRNRRSAATCRSNSGRTPPMCRSACTTSRPGSAHICRMSGTVGRNFTGYGGYRPGLSDGCGHPRCRPVLAAVIGEIPKQAFRPSSFALVLAVENLIGPRPRKMPLVERALIRIPYKKCSIARMGITSQSAGGARRKQGV